MESYKTSVILQIQRSFTQADDAVTAINKGRVHFGLNGFSLDSHLYFQ